MEGYLKGLTKRQREILDYIKHYIETNKFSPSYREIMNHFGFSSIASVSKHLMTLQRKEAISLEKNGHRSIIPNDSPLKKIDKLEVELPFIGHIMEGVPIETFPRSQTLPIPRFLIKDVEKTYVLRASGKSLNKEMIADGDFLLVEARSEALAGDTVIGTAKQHGTCIKQYQPEGNSIRLTSHLSESITLRNEDLTIHGVVVGLWRFFH